MEGGIEAEIRISRKEGPDETVIVVRSPFSIGRTGADLNLDDGSVSRRHCELARVGADWIIRDLKSSNGTFVNGAKVLEKYLNDGDTIKIGQTEMKLALVASSEPSIVAQPVIPAELTDNTALWSIVELSVGIAEEKNWLQSYLETMMKRFHSERGFIVGYNKASGAVAMEAAISMDFGEISVDDKVPLSKTIVEQAIAEKRAIVTTNAEVDPRFKEATSVAQYDIRTVICAPIRWHGVPTGAIYLERVLAKEAYSEEESHQFQDLADLLGVARMAWRGHISDTRSEWEKENLGRIFPASEVATILGAGGAVSIKRRVREVCALYIHLSKMDELLAGINEEAWRLVSQFYAQMNEIIQRHGGALVTGGCAMFGALDDSGNEYHADAVRAAVEIQKVARLLVKRMAREMKLSLAVGAGIATSQSLVGWFGAGTRLDFLGTGVVIPAAMSVALQAVDDEVIIEQATYNKVRLFVNTHRLAPVNLPGVGHQIQLFRVVPY
jgi:adenylate cyclase